MLIWSLTSGKHKFVDFVDCTGSGDVSLHIAPLLDDGNSLLGLSGRTLRLSKDWINPTGLFKIGIKRSNDLFPASLVTRLNKKRKEDVEKQHQIHVAAVQER